MDIKWKKKLVELHAKITSEITGYLERVPCSL